MCVDTHTCCHTLQLWEEDLADFDDLWSGYGTAAANAAAAAAGDETEDSNAGTIALALPFLHAVSQT